MDVGWRAAAGLALGCLQAISTASAQSILRDDFDGAAFAPAGRLFYKKNAEQAAGTYAFQSDVVRSGPGALRLSVREACPKADSDCSERAEVWEKADEHVPYLQGAWYAFSVKFAEPVPQDDHRYVIAQWKRDILPNATADYSPLLALRLNRGKLFATIETDMLAASGDRPGPDGCPSGQTPVWIDPSRAQARALIAAQPGWRAQDGPRFAECTADLRIEAHGAPLPAPESGWIDFVIYSRPGPKGDGRVEIIANGKPVVTATGQIGHGGEGLGVSQYFKFGPYRAGGTGEWALYFDNFRRGPGCLDVAEAAACAPPS